MHGLWSSVDWQLTLKLECQPFHFRPVDRLSFFNKKNVSQTLS